MSILSLADIAQDEDFRPSIRRRLSSKTTDEQIDSFHAQALSMVLATEVNTADITHARAQAVAHCLQYQSLENPGKSLDDEIFSVAWKAFASREPTSSITFFDRAYLKHRFESLDDEKIDMYVADQITRILHNNGIQQQVDPEWVAAQRVSLEKNKRHAAIEKIDRETHRLVMKALQPRLQGFGVPFLPTGGSSGGTMLAQMN